MDISLIHYTVPIIITNFDPQWSVGLSPPDGNGRGGGPGSGCASSGAALDLGGSTVINCDSASHFALAIAAVNIMSTAYALAKKFNNARQKDSRLLQNPAVRQHRNVEGH